MLSQLALQFPDRDPRHHRDDDKAPLPLLQKRPQRLTESREHHRLHTQKEQVGTCNCSGVIRDNSADFGPELLRLFRMPVHQQQLVVFLECSGSRQCASHVSCSDKCQFHSKFSPFVFRLQSVPLSFSSEAFVFSRRV